MDFKKNEKVLNTTLSWRLVFKEGKPTLPQPFSCYQEVNCRQNFIQFSSLKSLSEWHEVFLK